MGVPALVVVALGRTFGLHGRHGRRRHGAQGQEEGDEDGHLRKREEQRPERVRLVLHEQLGWARRVHTWVQGRF